MRIIPSFCFVVFFFTSCSSLVQIEKREYGNGFYIHVNKKNATADLNHCNSDPSKFPKTLFVTDKNLLSESTNSSSSQKNSSNSFVSICFLGNSKSIQKTQKHFTSEKETKNNYSKKIVVPKEPINKKAKAAYILLNISRFLLGAAFIVMLCGLINLFLIIAGVAAAVALFSILFGKLAKKEIDKEAPVEKELGSERAQYAIDHALVGLVYFTLLILLAILVDKFERSRGN